jgi:hypothetical protein
LVQVSGFEGGGSWLGHISTPLNGFETFDICIEPKHDDKT